MLIDWAANSNHVEVVTEIHFDGHWKLVAECFGILFAVPEKKKTMKKNRHGRSNRKDILILLGFYWIWEHLGFY